MEQKHETRWKRSARRFFRNKSAVISLVIFVLVVLVCVIGPYFYPYNGLSIDLKAGYSLPSLEHPLGTDSLGRDMAARIMYGGRITLGITLTAVLISLAGLILGLVAGYAGGRTDAAISRINDALASIPTFLMVLFAENIIGWGDGNYRYALGIALIPPLVRVARSAAMNVKSQEYIEAARALGVKTHKIVFGHVLRNIAAPVIVHVTGSAADTLIMCTIMGYLGVGINPPTPEWGAIVHGGFGVILAKPMQMIIPCTVIVLCVLSLNLIGNGLRDALSMGKETT